MRVRIFQWFAALLVLVSLSGMARAAGPDEVVRQGTNDLLSTIQQHRTTYKQNPKQFYEAVDQVLSPVIHFDFFSKLVMGDFYASATPEQRQRFSGVFKNLVLEKYAALLLNYGGEKIEVLPLEKNHIKDNRAFVRLVLHGAENASYQTNFYLADFGEDNWRVYNIVFGGVNLVTTFKSQFRAIAHQKNGDIDAVIDGWGTVLDSL